VKVTQFGGYIAAHVLQGKYASWIPDIVFSTLAVVTGVLALLLPETLNRPLPETVKDVQSWTRSIAPPAAGPEPRFQPPKYDESVKDLQTSSL